MFVSIGLIRAQLKHNLVGKYIFFPVLLPFYYMLSMFQLHTEMYISTLEEKDPLFAILCLKILMPDTDLYLQVVITHNPTAKVQALGGKSSVTANP